VLFEADYDEIELQNMVMYSIFKKIDKSPLRHQNNVTNFFPIWAPPNQNFWLRQWSWVNNLMVFKKRVLLLKKWFWSWS